LANYGFAQMSDTPTPFAAALPLSVPPSALPTRTLACVAGALAARVTILVKKPGAV
jgi:hypothetical protein